MSQDLARARASARQLYVDHDRWLVYELQSPFDRRGPSLIFESDTTVRRVRAYPPDWRELPAAELALIMEGA